MTELVKKSALASLLIGLGNYVLLKIGNPIGAFLFAFGLLGVCVLGANLFTGKCGFFIEDNIKTLDLLIILVVNLVAGYLFGVIFGASDGAVYDAALEKVANWDVSMAFLAKSLMCGAIMYLAVLMYRKGTALGILLGVPLFILCGFQHCIANVITLGIARTFDISLVVAIIGNFVGAIFVSWLIRPKKKEEI